jgi:hypothetical protein
MEKEKKYYRLWFEYLKRSDKYRSLCAKIQNILQCKAENTDIPAEDNLDFIDFVISNNMFATSEDAMPGCNFGPEIMMLFRYFPYFGDVFLNSKFDQAWGTISQFLRQQNKEKKNLESSLIGDSIGFARLLQKDNKTEKSIGLGNLRLDLETADINRFPVEGTTGLFLCYVDFRADKVKLEADFKKLLDQNWHRHKPIRPPFLFRTLNNTQYENLKRYLKVFDAKKQGKKTLEIANEVFNYSVGSNTEPELIKEISREYYCAKNLISNLEHGIFPRVSKIKR